MPLEYRIDHDRRMVQARGMDVLTDEDVFKYQREVWSRPEVSGYAELMDLTEVREINLPSIARIHDLADLAAAMDQTVPGGKTAVVAPSDLVFGMARMYQAYRSLGPGEVKEFKVYRTMQDALAYLGVKGPLELSVKA